MAIHTQSPATGPAAFTGQVLGGLDDRFDFQLVSGEFQDGEGPSFLTGSYHAFGNNGTHVYSEAITTGTGAAPAVLTALAQSSDHLPVVADYQLPAKLGVQVASIPTSVSAGAAVSVNVLVQNLASAFAAIGADELDYTLSVSGDLLGGITGVDFALGGGNTHQVTLNTSTTGTKSGVITVSTMSQGAANPLFTLPVSFVVGGGGTVTREVIARDDFDAPLNLISFSQAPLPGAFSSTASGFQEYQVDVSPSIPPALVDTSTDGSPTDSRGVINSAAKSDAWFGVVDTFNGSNPSGDAAAAWQFNVGGASSLEVSIDMAAMGDFESAEDAFDWTYSLDGGAFQPLFTSSVNDDSSANYTMAGGAVILVADPLFMTTTSTEMVQLSNVLATLTSPIIGVGNSLVIRLDANTNGQDEAYAFDNIVVTGLVAGFAEADFDEDGVVNGGDLATWRSNFGLAASAEKDDGDADADGDVDGADLLVWQQQLGATTVVAAAATVPEPAALALAAWLVVMAPAWRRCK
jgi:hypothetical protein